MCSVLFFFFPLCFLDLDPPVSSSLVSSSSVSSLSLLSSVQKRGKKIEK
jgi:hypothetical protein